MFTSISKRPLNCQPRAGEAIIISFFGGDPYYARCAQRLAQQCDQFDLAHDICEYRPEAEESWINICRRKIRFYSEKLREHQSDVMWVDVDAQIIADPRRILRSKADIGAFLRNFRGLVGFDPMQFARLLHPGYLRFAHSLRTLAFMDAMDAIDRTADPSGTDDFVLQEALKQCGEHLSFDLFSPGDIVFSNESVHRGAAIFQHGDSGNVRENIAVATQHDAAVLTVERQKRVLISSADALIKEKEFGGAAAFLGRALKLDPNDAASTLKLMRVYHRLRWKKKYAELVATGEANPELAPKVRRYRYELASTGTDLDGIAHLGERLEREGSDEDRAFVASRRYRLSFDLAARERQVPDDQRVRLWWWERPYPGNLGDMINPYVVEGLTGTPPKFAGRGSRVLAIGSIIKFAKKGDRVWGAGCPAADQPIQPEAIFHAVRGPLTRNKVLEAGGACEPVYGDPAWLLPLIYPGRGLAKTHRLGLIRHFTHRQQPITLGDDVREIEILRSGRDGIEAFLDEMLACEAIVSTSLHGVILANAYGIPARWATFSASDRQIHGDGMKFDDYFLSIGRKALVPLDLSGVERLSGRVARQCSDNPARGIDLEALIAAAPFDVDPEILARRKPTGARARVRQLLGLGA